MIDICLWCYGTGITESWDNETRRYYRDPCLKCSKKTQEGVVESLDLALKGIEKKWKKNLKTQTK